MTLGSLQFVNFGMHQNVELGLTVEPPTGSVHVGLSVHDTSLLSNMSARVMAIIGFEHT